MKIHHIGYLVRNIDKGIERFKQLGYVTVSETVYDKYREIDVVFMTNCEYNIELVSPKAETSVVTDTINKLGNTPYHICYCCHNLEEKVKELRKLKYIPINDPAPAPALNNHRVVFLFNKDVGIIELLEQKKG